MELTEGTNRVDDHLAHINLELRNLNAILCLVHNGWERGRAQSPHEEAQTVLTPTCIHTYANQTLIKYSRRCVGSAFKLFES